MLAPKINILSAKVILNASNFNNTDIINIAIIFVLLVAIAILIYQLIISNQKIKLLAIELSENKLHAANLKEINSDNNKVIEELKRIIEQHKKDSEDYQNRIEEIERQIHTEALKRTSELHTQLEKSEESNKLKEAFLEKISREVRTPLNAILGFINLLNNPDLPEHDRAHYYKYIQDSGNNLLGLIDNIIDFSKLETNELLIEPKKCKLNIMIADMVEKYRNRIIRENTDLVIILNNTDKDIESLADCKRIIHIADQLVSNAVKFTQTGKIEITYKIIDNNHFFQVSDTGIGIDKKYQDIIFERFYQIEPESRAEFQGAGLGLTIAKGLIDLLGGKIWVESSLDKGSKFTFTIPFIGIDSLTHQKAKPDKNYSWKGKNILIAEDEDSNYHFLKAILKKTEATLIRASDGVKFLEIMNERKDIDLVLLDIKMPGINGFNAIKVVRQQNISIPVIAQTAFNQPEDKQRCLDSGCNDYLAKPIDKELLLSKISKFFQ